MISCNVFTRSAQGIALTTATMANEVAFELYAVARDEADERAEVTSEPYEAELCVLVPTEEGSVCYVFNSDVFFSALCLRGGRAVPFQNEALESLI